MATMSCTLDRDHLSTKAIDPLRRLSQWEQWVVGLHGNLSFHRSLPRNYDGRLSTIGFDKQRIVRFEAEPASMVRAQAHIRSDEFRHYEIVLPLSGDVCIAHSQRSSILRVGQLMLIDMSRPIIFEHGGHLACVTLGFSREELDRDFPEFQDACGQVFAEHPLMGPALSYAAELARQPTGMDRLSFSLARRHLAELFALIVQDRGDIRSTASPVAAATLRRIMRFIRAELANEDLDLPLIAGANGVSVRYVQVLFASTGTTARAFICRERLKRAADLLSDTHKRATITEVALASGFSSSNHFGVAFRKMFDCTPSEFRRRYRQGSNASRA